jgi:hypothetical protein
VDAKAIKVAAKEKYDLEQAAKKKAAEFMAAKGEAMAKGKANTTFKAKQVPVNVQQSAVEETAPKKAKVSKFDSVDMEIEALAYRIDSIDSNWVDTSRRRSGWR